MDRTILILSTEPWGKMLLSKMHFALELARKGDKVYFVNPARRLSGKKLAVRGEDLEGGAITIIHTNIVRSSLFLRHKLFFLYRLLDRRYIGAIKKIVGSKIDEVWNFNPNQYVDLRSFGAEKSIVLLYDLYQGGHIFKALEKADALVTISQVILDHYKSTAAPKLLLQHGLAPHFAEKSRQRLGVEDFGTGNGDAAGKDRIKVGYTGNLLRTGMNTEVARAIVERHPEIEFHFWGPHSAKDNNVSDSDYATAPELLSFVEFLRSQRNVFLHGVVTQQELAERLFEMDAFLFLYSPTREVNGASNAHKLLEYISTGKVVIATHVSNYAGTDLLVMCDNRDEEDKLSEIFDRTVRDLDYHNAKERQIRRISFALDNTYTRQVERVEKFIAG
jgi:glycosyltransferase involved in cell wall biosynthesis